MCAVVGVCIDLKVEDELGWVECLSYFSVIVED